MYAKRITARNGRFVIVSWPPGVKRICSSLSPDVFSLTDATSNARGPASGVRDCAAILNPLMASAAAIALLLLLIPPLLLYDRLQRRTIEGAG